MNEGPLALSSPRWSELTQAFGTAEDVPRLLASLATAQDERERAELWYGVAATLCPGGRVFSASYAAAPHLLSITADMALAERVVAVQLVSEIEVARHEVGTPAIPGDVLLAYAHAIESLPAVVAELAAVSWDEGTAQLMSAALAVGKRQPALARRIMALGDAG
ncbi:MAG: hypothetical protein ABJA80_06000 [bacterium]